MFNFLEHFPVEINDNNIGVNSIGVEFIVAPIDIPGYAQLGTDENDYFVIRIVYPRNEKPKNIEDIKFGDQTLSTSLNTGRIYGLKTKSKYIGNEMAKGLRNRLEYATMRFKNNHEIGIAVLNQIFDKIPSSQPSY